MHQNQPGQMTWKPEGAIETGILHLRHHTSEDWKPCTEFPEYFVPDPPKLDCSPGYATFLSLLKKKWQLL
jgi:hypothetical protein